jgi:hypothetical protein
MDEIARADDQVFLDVVNPMHDLLDHLTRKEGAVVDIRELDDGEPSETFGQVCYRYPIVVHHDDVRFDHHRIADDEAGGSEYASQLEKTSSADIHVVWCRDPSGIVETIVICL